MPAAFGDMMLAVDDLNNKVSEVLVLGIGLGLTAGVILGAIELGLDAAATLLAAAGAGADLTMLRLTALTIRPRYRQTASGV